jgi:hypothetical protein
MKKNASLLTMGEELEEEEEEEEIEELFLLFNLMEKNMGDVRLEPASQLSILRIAGIISGSLIEVAISLEIP